MIRSYYQLTKPGIIYGNAITALAGFFLAARNHIDVILLLGMLIGTSLIIASACVFNNYIDRNIDKKMARTKHRALVEGTISGRNALIYATILGLLGFYILNRYTNLLTVVVGIVGFVDYVILYGISKRSSVYSTLIGSISGATPIVAGYTAVTNHFDAGAVLLFLILVFWQMPHFYAIGIYRLNDYKNAGLPILPVQQGINITKIHMLVYLIGFIIATSLLSIFGYASRTYLILILLFGLYWLWWNIKGFQTKDVTKWARKMFFLSLILILALSVLLSINSFLP